MNANNVRYVSGKIFGNEKAVEVILALAAEPGVATAKTIATRAAIDHSLARDVLLRLVDAGLLTPMPRTHSRAPRYYEVSDDDPIWLALLDLAKHVARRHGPIVDHDIQPTAAKSISDVAGHPRGRTP